jgi:hypothetical protein
MFIGTMSFGWIYPSNGGALPRMAGGTKHTQNSNLSPPKTLHLCVQAWCRVASRTKGDHIFSNIWRWSKQIYNPVNLRNYNYMVHPDDVSPTVSYVWEVLERIHMWRKVCLSFALFQLLRRRSLELIALEPNLWRPMTSFSMGCCSTIEENCQSYRIIQTKLAFAPMTIYSSTLPPTC